MGTGYTYVDTEDTAGKQEGLQVPVTKINAAGAGEK